ncbi:MAG TPA: hypothetical protein VFJ72_00490 [Rubrobacteraceae bacterium]|nr:hypothetical protein [Rubrobacteraceae bacterium]
MARRLDLDARLGDWRTRSGKVIVSKVAENDVGDEAETQAALNARVRIW